MRKDGFCPGSRHAHAGFIVNMTINETRRSPQTVAIDHSNGWQLFSTRWTHVSDEVPTDADIYHLDFPGQYVNQLDVIDGDVKRFISTSPGYCFFTGFHIMCVL